MVFALYLQEKEKLHDTITYLIQVIMTITANWSVLFLRILFILAHTRTKTQTQTQTQTHTQTHLLHSVLRKNGSGDFLCTSNVNFVNTLFDQI